MFKATMRFLLGAVVCLALAPRPATADPLANLLPNLIGGSIVLDNPNHQAHFQASGAEAGQSFNRNLVGKLERMNEANRDRPEAAKSLELQLLVEEQAAVAEVAAAEAAPVVVEEPAKTG